MSEPSPSKMYEGQRDRRSNEHEQSIFAPAYGWWHQTNDGCLKVGKVSWSQGPSHKSNITVRREVIARLADRAVVAMTPRDNTTLAEQRARGVAAYSMKRGQAPTCAGIAVDNGYQLSCSGTSTKTAANSLLNEEGCGSMPCSPRYFEAVLGKTHRTEFHRGRGKRADWSTLNWHEAGNGGYSQAMTCTAPRSRSTYQTKFRDCSYGFRPGRSTTQALEKIRDTDLDGTLGTMARSANPSA